MIDKKDLKPGFYVVVRKNADYDLPRVTVVEYVVGPSLPYVREIGWDGETSPNDYDFVRPVDVHVPPPQDTSPG